MSNDERPARGFRFRKSERIRTRREIGLVFERGSRWSVKGLRLHAMPNGGADTRAVFVTVRKYGDAVRRNRARRVVSECWRLAKNDARQGFDLAFVIYPGPDTAADRAPQMNELIRRAGLVA